MILREFIALSDSTVVHDVCTFHLYFRCNCIYDVTKHYHCLHNSQIQEAEKKVKDKDRDAAALLPPSARGVWNYTVGLVGKPSAGKSTFYNAVTRASLERGGRLMAEVAPHPFTTIEPNIGTLFCVCMGLSAVNFVLPKGELCTRSDYEVFCAFIHHIRIH